MKRPSRPNMPLFSSRLTATVSVALVLLLLGVASLLGLAANNIANNIRSSMGFVIIMADDASPVDTGSLKQRLTKAPYTSSLKFTTADEVMKRWQSMVGDNGDLDDLLDSNPFAPEIEVNVNPTWAVADSLEAIKAVIETNPAVDEVKIHTSMVNDINSAFTNIAMILIIVAVTLLAISFVLINNTVRLTIYARRFTIHTMKLVGATPGFIRSPIIKSNIMAGLIAGLIADAMIAGTIAYGHNAYPDFSGFISWTDAAWVLGAIPPAGIIVCMMAAWGASNRYIRLNYDNLFR